MSARGESMLLWAILIVVAGLIPALVALLAVWPQLTAAR